MRDLRELVSIVNRHKIKTLEILGPALPPNSKIMQLYEGISSGVFESDEEAMAFLYGNPENSKNSYWKLKHDLKRRLLNTVFFIDRKQDRQSNYERSFYNCYRELTAARFLLRRGSRQIAVELLHKVLKKAEQIELTPVTLEALQLLRHHYGVILGDRRKFEEYDKLVDRHLHLYQAEVRADGYMEEMLSHYVTDKSTKKHHFDKVEEYEKALKEMLREAQSQKLQHRCSFMTVAKNMIVNDYEATVQACLKAIRHFKRLDQIPDSYIRPYLYQLVVSYIQLKAYKKGEEAVRQLLGMLEPGQSNWFKGMELSCVLALHSKNYPKAFDIWTECTAHPQFRYLYPTAKEPWHIMEAFIYYTYTAGKMGGLEGYRFKLGKFINEVPLFSKDKRGYNIPILIIQILFLIHQGNYDAVYERLDALSRYAIRHLRREEHYRTNCFIRMLNQLPRAFFRRRELERMTALQFRQLHNVPLGLAREAHEIEIIPYEDLWALVLEGLKA
ncbi:MAG: hypothetical protein WA004_05990 [Saprospiraceae bacterium]